MYWSLAFLHFFQKHFYYSATFRQHSSIPSTLSHAFSVELRREDHATSPRSRDIYSTVIGPFYFIYFNIFFLPYKLRFLIISHPKYTLHTKFTDPCSPIYAPRSSLAALRSHASNPCRQSANTTTSYCNLSFPRVFDFLMFCCFQDLVMDPALLMTVSCICCRNIRPVPFRRSLRL